jgi:hypothetical protein
VLFRLFARFEGAEIPPLAGFRVPFPRIKPVFARFQSPDHVSLPPQIPFYRDEDAGFCVGPIFSVPSISGTYRTTVDSEIAVENEDAEPEIRSPLLEHAPPDDFDTQARLKLAFDGYGREIFVESEDENTGKPTVWYNGRLVGKCVVV